MQVQAASPQEFDHGVCCYGYNCTNLGEWTSVTGHYRPRLLREYLNIMASCDFEDSSYLGRVFIDDVVLAPTSCEDGV